MSYLLLLGGPLALPREFPEADGGKGKMTFYGGAIPCANRRADSVSFSTELEHVLFRLNSVRNKYRVVRIKIRNNCNRDLVLDPAADSIQIHLKNGVVTGFLDLERADAALWNDLDPDLKRDLAYPKKVERGEEENIFLFAPQAQLPYVPEGFRYVVRSLGTPIAIRDLTPVAAE
jgi:hypothetical protein